MRPSHAIFVLAFLVAGCAGGTDAPPSATPAASRSPSEPSAGASASAAAVETDWSALPALDHIVTGTVPLTAAFPGRYSSATAHGLWIPNGNAGDGAAVVRLDPDTLEVLATIDLGGVAGAIPPDAEATAPSANGVWVTLASQDAVALVDPATNRESRRIRVDGDPYSLAEDGENLWVTDFGGAVVRVDVASGDELLRVRSISGPTQVAVAFGGVWVADHNSGDIVRLDPVTGEVLATIPVGGRPGIAIGFGSVWARSDDEQTVSRIDPSTDRVVATISMPSFPNDIEVAGDSVWVAGGPQRGSCERNSYLVRIDPDSNEADGFMPMSCPTMLATDGTRFWAGSTKDGETEMSIISLDPRRQP